MTTLKSDRSILFVVNVDWFFISHRLPIALEAMERGWTVYLACSNTGRFEELISLGIKPLNVEIDRSGKNIFKEWRVVQQLQRIYMEYKPDVIHHITLKMAIYGSLAAKRSKDSKVVNAISGLGFSFTAGRKSLTQRIILRLMVRAFKGQGQVFIFQNPDDESMFHNLGLGVGNTSVIIKGSGVDLNQFSQVPVSQRKTIRFVLTARMLKDKGVSEFVGASTLVHQKRPGKAEFVLIGGIDSDNPAGYKESELLKLIEKTPVKWVGFRDDVRKELSEANVVVLPSYREGLPKSLIEAAAVGRPIVTTDAIGCRECVDDGVNGFLVPVGDSFELSRAMIRLLDDPSLRSAMGKESRLKAEREFSIESVLDKTFMAYGQL